MLTPDMRAVIRSAHLCFAATVTSDGRPNVSPKGTIRVWDDTQLFFLDIASPGTRTNLAHAPWLELNVVDQLSRRGIDSAGRRHSISRTAPCMRTPYGECMMRRCPPIHRRRSCCSRSSARRRCSLPRTGVATTKRRFERYGASGGPRWIVSSRRTSRRSARFVWTSHRTWRRSAEYVSF